MIGVRADGIKELVALTDGHRESSERSRSSPTTSMCCWSSTTTLPGTESTCVPEPDRVDLRHRPPSAAGHQGARIAAAGVAMAFKLIESAQQRWRAVNAPHLVALVRAGARFEKGLLVERPDESGGDQQVE
jgi:hypothetical protein